MFTPVPGRYGDDCPTDARRPCGAVQCAVQSGNENFVLVVGFVEPPGREQCTGHEYNRNHPTNPHDVLQRKHEAQHIISNYYK